MSSSNISAVSAAARYWDNIVGLWNDHNQDTVWRAHSDSVNAALLARWLPAGRLGRVLKTDLFDEAVADGLYPLLQARTEHVNGIDISPNVVDAALARYPRLLGVAADVSQLPFDSGQFDVVVSISTLDHFESVDKISASLSELHRILRPGGRLIITLDNGSNPAVALRNRLPYSLLQRLHLVPYRNGATCRAGRFLDLLGSCSFKVQDVSFTVHAPRAPAVLLARIVQQMSNPRLRARFLRMLAKGETLAGWPTRAWTGYFVAVLATKG